MPFTTSQTQGDRSRLLADTSAALSRDAAIWTSDTGSALRHIARACANVVGVDRASIWRLDNDLSRMVCLTLYREDLDRHEAGMELTARQYPRYFAALSCNRVIAAHDAMTDPCTREFGDDYLKPEGVVSMLDAAVRIEGKVGGILCLESCQQLRHWTWEEQEFAASVADLVSQVLVFNKLRNSEAHYRALFDCSGDGIFVIRNGCIVDCNATAVALFGSNREHLQGLRPDQLSPPLQPDGSPSASKAKMYMHAALEGRMQMFEWTHLRIDGSTFQAEVSLKSMTLDGEPCVMGSVRDISYRNEVHEALESSRRQLEFRANHDSLTGLPNRDRLHQRAAAMMQMADERGGQVAFMLLDLNRFKEVNDTLGHRIGDQLLKQLASRLRTKLETEGAELFRLGGDEFAVLSGRLEENAQVMALAQSVDRCVRLPLAVADMSLEIGASIGIALYPEHGGNSHALLRCADVAMYHAKNHGTGSSFYDSAQDSHSPRRLSLMAELGVAIRENQLLLHFQPRVDLRSGECTGCEALLRWQHPVHGMVPPGDFIPVAEMSDVIHALSLWVVRNALEHIRRWLEAGWRIPVAINLSARNLVDMSCPERIERLLTEYQVDPPLLEIEITESALISDPDRALQVVDRLHEMGMPLAIDDFGTGYSSLSYLKRLPVNTLKVDRSFVKDILVDEADAVIVRSTIALAHSFGLKVVAEGVEDERTLEVLRSMDCEQAQGYHIARPLPLPAFEDWLRRHFAAGEVVSP